MRSTEPDRDRIIDLAARSSTEQGFTLIETTVAMLIMMIAGLGVVSLFVYSIGYNSGGNDRAVAISLAQQQVEQFLSDLSAWNVRANSSSKAHSKYDIYPFLKNLLLLNLFNNCKLYFC